MSKRYDRVFRAVKQTIHKASSLREFMSEPRVYRSPGKDNDTRAIAHLQRLSKKAALGDKVSAHLLMVITTEAVCELNAAIAEQPELFRQMARTVPAWPILWTSVPLIKEQFKAQTKLEIGQALPHANHKARLSRKAKPANIAISAVNYMSLVLERYQDHPDLTWQQKVRALPPYDQNSARKWWRLAEQEIQRSFPSLHQHLLGAYSYPRDLGEALRRVGYPFRNSAWKAFEFSVVP
jgi:hypothetical protein